jgi:hypothetical protein
MLNNMQFPDIFSEETIENRHFLCNYCQTALGLSDRKQESSIEMPVVFTEFS